jgi:hypothetical protein
MGQYDEISEAEIIQHSYLVPRELDTQFMNPIFQKVGIGAGKVWTILFQQGNPAQQLCLVAIFAGIDKVLHKA